MKEYIITEHPLFPYADPKPPELVRCKDCFHYHDGYVLPKHCALTGWATEPNDYCSSAEKRSDFYSIENDGTYSTGGGDDCVHGGGNG